MATIMLRRKDEVMTDDQYRKTIILNPTPYQQARISNVKGSQLIRKNDLPKNKILSGASALLLEPTTVLTKGFGAGAEKVEQRRERIARGDMREFRKVIGETVTATGEVALATLTAGTSTGRALGYKALKSLAPTTIKKGVETALIGGTTIGILSASPTAREFVRSKVENVFLGGEYIGEGIEYLKDRGKKTIENTKKDPLKNLVLPALGGAGAVLGAQKIYNYFADKTEEIPNVIMPSGSQGLSSVGSNIPTSAQVEPINSPSVISSQSSGTETGATLPVPPVSVKVSNKINIDNRSSANRRHTKNYIKKQVINK